MIQFTKANCRNSIRTDLKPLKRAKRCKVFLFLIGEQPLQSCKNFARFWKMTIFVHRSCKINNFCFQSLKNYIFWQLEYCKITFFCQNHTQKKFFYANCLSIFFYANCCLIFCQRNRNSQIPIENAKTNFFTCLGVMPVFESIVAFIRKKLK